MRTGSNDAARSPIVYAPKLAEPPVRAVTKQRRMVAGVIAVCACSGCAGSSAPPSATESSSVGTAAAIECPTDARETGPSIVGNGGPTLGPVTFALSVNGTTEPVRGQDRVDGRIRTKVLLIIDAPAGRPFRLKLAGTEPGANARFTHQQRGTSWDVGVAELAGPVPMRRSGSPNRPADVPGYLLATKAGCYAVDVSYDGRRLGTIGLRLVAPAA